MWSLRSGLPCIRGGQPLNPKKLIQDMVVGFAGGTDEHYAGSPYPGIDLGHAKGAPNQIITDGLIHPDTLWSCTTCRACVEECPMMIEHVDAIVDMRRFLTLERQHHQTRVHKSSKILSRRIIRMVMRQRVELTGRRIRICLL